MYRTLLLIFLLGCSATPSAPKPATAAWINYVVACTARAQSAIERPLCPAFPVPPGGDGEREKMLGAAIGLAQDVGEIVMPLVIPALAGKAVAE